MSKSIETIRANVLEALFNSQENGYYLETENLNYQEIAQDLIDCDQHLEDNSIQELLPFIKEYFDKLK